MLVLVPRTFLIGVSILAATMLGAMFGWMFVLHEPRSAMLPALLLAILLAVGRQCDVGGSDKVWHSSFLDAAIAPATRASSWCTRCRVVRRRS